MKDQGNKIIWSITFEIDPGGGFKIILWSSSGALGYAGTPKGPCHVFFLKDDLFFIYERWLQLSKYTVLLTFSFVTQTFGN